MAFDETTLSETHTITRLSIQSNTQISAKATNVISKLSPSENSTTDPSTSKPPLIILRAQSRWASKLISIVEIARRNLESPPCTTSGGDSSSSGIKVFQYSSLSTEIVEFERKPKPKPKGLVGGAQLLPEGGGEEEDDDDECAFQTMGASSAATAASGGGLKKRAVPVLTVYLAGKPVKALRSEFGWVRTFFFFFLYLCRA
jgi:hypothetical protein